MFFLIQGTGTLTTYELRSCFFRQTVSYQTTTRIPSCWLPRRQTRYLPHSRCFALRRSSRPRPKQATIRTQQDLGLIHLAGDDERDLPSDSPFNQNTGASRLRGPQVYQILIASLFDFRIQLSAELENYAPNRLKPVPSISFECHL